ncbi:MAG: hypothetical protein U9O97_00065 [Elusimicrobiota bacterium]|nr:hypothetical protein [Elusimicrobiota bacterium]
MKTSAKRSNDFSAMARELGRKGGLARAKKLSPEKKSESAFFAAKIRWRRKRKGDKLRRQLKNELISTAKKKTGEERLDAYFNLSRGIAALSLSGKNSRSFKIAR